MQPRLLPHLPRQAHHPRGAPADAVQGVCSDRSCHVNFVCKQWPSAHQMCLDKLCVLQGRPQGGSFLLPNHTDLVSPLCAADLQARLTLCPICRERIMPPTIEPVVVTAPGEVAAAAIDGTSDGGGTRDGGADGGSDSRPGWRRMLPTPLPPREWIAVAWWRRRRQRRRQQTHSASDQPDVPTGSIPVASPVHTDSCP